MHKTLVSVETLKSQLADPRWVVFDCRSALEDPEWGPAEYRASHIPGARYAHLDRDLSAPQTAGAGRHPLPRPEDFIRWLGDNGVGRDSQVIAYDQGGGAFAARLWWMMRWVGHPAAAVLDGGWAAWQAAGGPESEDVPAPEPVNFAGRADDALWLTSEQLEQALDAGGVTLVDARGAPRYRGETEPIDPVAGHVPGAVNLPFMGNLDDNGQFRDAESLRRRFEDALGDAAGARVVHMCGSGVTACHNLLAMEVAGLGESRLYAGSWSEWITDPRRPVATGDEG
ncbi:MAG TPA: sulfurtransferase [Arenicellales bacterium]|nr:sulfurtransferase [Arenicellales bacterium]